MGTCTSISVRGSFLGGLAALGLLPAQAAEPAQAPAGGKYQADPPESAWPRPFLEHAKKVWQRIVK